jgi:nicotinamide-nucleotide amidase
MITLPLATLKTALEQGQSLCLGATNTVAFLAVGNEVLVGDVMNTNASWLAKHCPAYDLAVSHHATVGDFPTAIATAVCVGLQQANGLIITGGLGPTDDDLTIATLADAFGVPLVKDEASAVHLEQWFQARFGHDASAKMPANNWKQTLIPQGAEAIVNPVGTAPATVWRLPSGQWIACLPGIPREVYALFPLLMAHLGLAPKTTAEEGHRIQRQSVYFYGVGESHLVEALGQALMTPSAPYTVAPYVENEQRIRIELTSRQPQTVQQAEAFFTQWRNAIPAQLKQFALPLGMPHLETWVVAQAKTAGFQLATAESCTGGLVSHWLTNVAGSSAVVSGNVVAYSNEVKHAWLGVAEETLATHGAVSQPVAEAMAVGVRLKSIHPERTIGLGVTGVAGPDGGSVEKPVGHVWMAVSLPPVLAEKLGTAVISKAFYMNPTLGRELLKTKFALEALQLFSSILSRDNG